MTRLNIVLLAVVALLLGGLITLWVRPGATLDEAGVRAVVADMLAKDAVPEARQSVAALDPETLNPLIESYLMGDPAILDRMNGKLQASKLSAARAVERQSVAANKAAIYDDPDHIVVGNPKGDVTLVEMFDYNCTFCRSALPDLKQLIAEDPNLRVVLKEFPILSQQSVDAARVAVLVGEDKSVDYWAFHEALFASRGQVTSDTALGVAAKLGMNRMTLAIDMLGKKPADVIQKTYDLAKALNVNGTPTFIIGDEVIPGAIGIDELRQRIANMRACGSTMCDAHTMAPAG